PLLADLADFLSSLQGIAVVDVCPSPVRGNRGTVEFFFHIMVGLSLVRPALDKRIAASVEQALMERTDV
ncbi:MAG: hypothetical protein PHG11_03245, partial [Eubacteriales bacterium]|nr:hypothetical protein [Eubacteriales bacterium]